MQSGKVHNSNIERMKELDTRVQQPMHHTCSVERRR